MVQTPFCPSCPLSLFVTPPLGIMLPDIMEFRVFVIKIAGYGAAGKKCQSKSYHVSRKTSFGAALDKKIVSFSPFCVKMSGFGQPIVQARVFQIRQQVHLQSQLNASEVRILLFFDSDSLVCSKFLSN